MNFDLFIELDKFNYISFNEELHEYKINNQKCISTTTLLNNYKKPFDTENIAWRYAVKNLKSVDEVIEEWEDKKNEASSKGTHLHRYAELKFACKEYDVPEESLPLILKQYIDKFYDDSIGRLIPIKSEMIVGDKDLKLCGMIDQLFYNVKEKEIQIWDYKTNKEIRTFSQYKNKMTNGLNHLQECEYNTYSLQLGIYKKIIERNTNLKLGKSYICWINDKNSSYKAFQMAEMDKEVDLIIKNIKQ